VFEKISLVVACEDENLLEWIIQFLIAPLVFLEDILFSNFMLGSSQRGTFIGGILNIAIPQKDSANTTISQTTTTTTTTKMIKKKNKNRQVPHHFNTKLSLQYQVETRCYTDSITLYEKFSSLITQKQQ